MKKQENWFTQKKTTAGFAILSLIAGFLFLNQSITGNFVLNADKGIDLISLIGLLLISCAIILGAYTIKKK